MCSRPYQREIHAQRWRPQALHHKLDRIRHRRTTYPVLIVIMLAFARAARQVRLHAVPWPWLGNLTNWRPLADELFREAPFLGHGGHERCADSAWTAPVALTRRHRRV